MPLPYLYKKNPFESILKMDTEENFHSSIEELKQAITESTSDNIYNFFYEQATNDDHGNLKTNLQRLFDALINADKKYIDSISEITLLALITIKADDHEKTLMPLEKILLEEHTQVSVLTKHTKLRILINHFSSETQSHEKLKELLTFLIKSLTGKKYFFTSREIEIIGTMQRCSALAIEVCQKQIPSFAYHVFFSTLNTLYYDTSLTTESKKSIGDYLRKYLQEISIATLFEIQNGTRTALHKLINEKNLAPFISKRIKNAEENPANFNSLIEQIETERSVFLFRPSLRPEEKELLIKAKLLITAFENNEENFEEVRTLFKKNLREISILNPKLQALIDKIDNHILSCIAPNFYLGVVLSTAEGSLYSRNHYLVGYPTTGTVVEDAASHLAL